MKRPAYDSPAVPIHWSRLQYVAGTREGLSVRPGTLERLIESYKDDPETLHNILGDNPFELSSIMNNWILSDNPELRFIPTDSIVITIDKEAVRRSGMMMAGDSIPDEMHISLKGKRAVYKSELMMYEMIQQCNWERPLYMAMTPFNTKKSGKDIDTEKMYENLMTRFAFGGIDKPGLYLDETVMRMCNTHRRIFSQLASRLVQEGKLDKAEKVVTKAEQAIPPTTVPHSYSGGSLELARVWNTLGKKKEAIDIAYPIAVQATEYLDWYISLPDKILLTNEKECMYYLYQMHAAVGILQSAGSSKAMELSQKLDLYNQLIQNRLYRSFGMSNQVEEAEEEEELLEEDSL